MKISQLIILFLFLFCALAVADDFQYHGSFLWNDIRDIKYQNGYLFCAFHDGIGVIDLQRDFIKKKIVSQLEIEGKPLRIFLSDSTMAVLTEVGQMLLVDVSRPEQLRLLGSFYPEWEIEEADFLGNYLYAAVGYGGLVRYDISDPQHVSLSDSSMIGIHVIDVHVHDSLVCALDDYNGILIYQPDTAAIGDSISQLLLPHQAVSFSICNDSVYAGLRPTGYMVGVLNNGNNPIYLETRSSLIRGDNIMPSDSGIILANSVIGFEIISQSGDMVFPVTDIRGRPEFFRFQDIPYVGYPQQRYGFETFSTQRPSLIDIRRPEMVLANPGPIEQIAFVKSRLHTIGENNWYEIYSVDNPDAPVRTGDIINPPYIPLGMCSRGDTLFIADRQTKLIFPAIDSGYANPWIYPHSFAIGNDLSKPYFIPNYFGNGDDLFYCFSEKYIFGASRSPSGVTANRLSWLFTDNVSSVLFDDTLLFTGLFNGDFSVYHITDTNVLEELFSTYVSGRVRDIVKNGDIIYLAEDGLLVVRMEDNGSITEVSSNPEIGTVYRLVRRGDWLYCAGANGIFIYDISAEIPRMLFSGGNKATMLAIDGQTIAASDGHSVRLYTLSSLDVDDGDVVLPFYRVPEVRGYPNPFNPLITLELRYFSHLGKGLVVDIYDILGRHVRSLEVNDFSTDKISLVWDGFDSGGKRASSGVYFFKAHTGSQQAVFKAILIK